MKNIFCTAALLLSLTLFGAKAPVGADDNSDSFGARVLVPNDGTQTLKWVPMPLDKLSEIENSTELSDVEKVAALTRILDWRISLEPAPNPTGDKPNPKWEFGSLIGRMAQRGNRTDAPGRPEAVQEVLDNLDAMDDIVNKEQVRTYLYLALGHAGGNPPERVLLRLLNDPTIPNEILGSTLGAIKKSKAGVSLRVLPRLLQFTEHPARYVFPPMLAGGTDDLGRRLDESRLIFPLRELACEVLQKLGVRCEKTLVEGNYDPKLKRKLPITVIKVDRRSATRALEQLRRGR